ncbi:MAG: alcohol dehydrogenase catalytic domain-containing protein, partial [Acidobacteriota bacterium]
MKALCKTQPSAGAELVDRDRPQAGPNEIVVEVRAAAICGTDKHLWQYDAWAAGRLKLPRVFGHECSGDVIEVGSEVTGVSVGDFVSLETHVPCGHCRLCRTDRQHICQNLKILGVDIDGCFAEHVKVPALCAWKNPGDMKPEVAAIQEPFGNAVYCCETGDVRAKSVAIIGDGPIACFATAIAKAWGAREVVVVGMNAARLGIA